MLPLCLSNNLAEFVRVVNGAARMRMLSFPAAKIFEKFP